MRSLDEFAKAAPKEADYDYDHPGLSLTQILGPGVEPEFKRITKEVAPKEDAEPAASASSEDEDPCAGSGYTTSEADWRLSHSHGRWVALLALRNTGPGVCSRQTEWQPLSQCLSPAIVGDNPVPVPWARVEAAFPGARHAFAAPKGDWLVVLTRTQVYLTRLSGGSIRKPIASAKIPYGIPVMSQWALGKYVSSWDQQVSKLPPPNDDVFLTPEPLD